MTKTVWKYQLSEAVNRIEIPEGASPIRVALQQEGPCLWCVVLPEAPKETRQFQVFGTGHKVPIDAKYVGSVQQGTFEWHVFEIPVREVVE